MKVTPEAGEDATLEERVRAELLMLRKQRHGLTVESLAHAYTICALLGHLRYIRSFPVQRTQRCPLSVCTSGRTPGASSCRIRSPRNRLHISSAALVLWRTPGSTFFTPTQGFGGHGSRRVEHLKPAFCGFEPQPEPLTVN